MNVSKIAKKGLLYT